MPNFSAFYGSSLTGTDRAEARAVAAWRRITEKPSSVIILRGNDDLPAQTVRIERGGTMPAEPSGGSNTVAAQQSVIIFGVVDHPTEADTNIRKGDRFVLNGADEYRVIDTFVYPGEIQATAERTR